MLVFVLLNASVIFKDIIVCVCVWHRICMAIKDQPCIFLCRFCCRELMSAAVRTSMSGKLAGVSLKLKNFSQGRLGGKK
jgi:hypothetical protein